MMNYAWNFCQSETEKYFEWIIIVFIIDVSRERKDKQIDLLSLRMLSLFTLPSWSHRQRETGLFGVVAKTWVFNFHFNLFRFVAFTLATRILQIAVLKLPLFSSSHISSSISKLCYLNWLLIHLYNVSMFHVTIKHGKQQTVRELYMDKIVLRAK